ncbi:hypothetical protein DNK41_01565 [Phytopseudomonas dryadis]|nr:hypothetical protein DNK41_01565 [Pseudomonas sp. FRB 230]
MPRASVRPGLDYEGRDPVLPSGALPGLGVRLRNVEARSGCRSGIDEKRLNRCCDETEPPEPAKRWFALVL